MQSALRTLLATDAERDLRWVSLLSLSLTMDVRACSVEGERDDNGVVDAIVSLNGLGGTFKGSPHTGMVYG